MEGESYLQERLSLSGRSQKCIQTTGMVHEAMLKGKLRTKVLTEYSENADA